jgi:hypothetical protein
VGVAARTKTVGQHSEERPGSAKQQPQLRYQQREPIHLRQASLANRDRHVTVMLDADRTISMFPGQAIVRRRIRFALWRTS